MRTRLWMLFIAIFWILSSSAISLYSQVVVTFPDANLEQAVRDELGKPTGDIYDTDMEMLINFIAGNKSIGSLTGLEYAVNLTSLSLENNNISDLTPLQNLVSLDNLAVCNNNISDVSSLENLTNLKSLVLIDNQIFDMSPLTNVSSLESIYLVSNNISNIPDMHNLTNLQYINLHGNQISNISALSVLTNLTGLVISKNNISDLTALQSLTKLGLLYINDNPISNLSPIHNLTALSSLFAYRMQINNLSALENLTNLTVLNVYGNQLQSLAGIEHLTKLLTIEAQDNNIKNISAIKNLTNLLYVIFQNNNLNNDDLKNLYNLDKLGAIIINGNGPFSCSAIHELAMNLDNMGYEDIYWDGTCQTYSNFTAIPVSGYRPLTVQFENLAYGIIDEFNWDMGDGHTKQTKNPLFTYKNAGMFTVTLTVDGPYGPDVKTYQDMITVLEPTLQLDYSDEQVTHFLMDSTYQITWQTEGVEKVKVELLDHGAPFLILADSAEASEPFEWLVPNSVPIGFDYQIKISSFTDTTVFDVSEPFAISSIKATAQKYFPLTNEKANEILGSADIYKIYTDPIDLTGKSEAWYYLYYNYEGEGLSSVTRRLILKATFAGIEVEQDTTFDAPLIGLFKLPEIWIDSDSAMTLANQSGGSLFCSAFSDCQISAQLLQATFEPKWVITYSSPAHPDQQLTISINAITGASISLGYDFIEFPNESGIALHVDSTYQIIWKGIELDFLIRIELYQNEQFVQMIADSVNLHQPFVWHLGSDLPLGSNYKIKVTVIHDPNNFDFSDMPFDIILAPRIDVTLLNARANYGPGDALEIDWENTGDVGDWVCIALYAGSYQNCVLCDRTENDGAYSWTIPSDISTLSDCRIKVISCMDSTVYDYSETSFDIQTTAIAQRLIPLKTELKGNYPNPFNPSTTIQYALAKSADMQFVIYDVLGKRVYQVSKHQEAGEYQIQWQAVDQSGQVLPSGVYFYRLEAGEYQFTRKMLLVR